MRFADRLVRGRFLAREKRFLVHVRLEDGRTVIAHTNNTGSMRGCLFPDAEVWLSPAANPARKLKWTLELVRTPEDVLVGVNTALANTLAREALEAGLVPELGATSSLRAEVAYPGGGSRADFRLEHEGTTTWIEVKNVSWVAGGRGRFPDAPTARGRKHLVTLMERVASGDGAALVFCLQRGDGNLVQPAVEVDPLYAQLLRESRDAGVVIAAVAMDVNIEGIAPRGRVPVDFE